MYLFGNLHSWKGICTEFITWRCNFIQHLKTTVLEFDFLTKVHDRNCIYLKQYKMLSGFCPVPHLIGLIFQFVPKRTNKMFNSVDKMSAYLWICVWHHNMWKYEWSIQVFESGSNTHKIVCKCDHFIYIFMP